MKNVAILSLSLVAVSGGAGLGLSALHEFNMNVQTSALAMPDNIPADSGFVIPDHVPDAAHFAATAPKLSVPQAIEAPVVEPVQTASLGDIELDEIVTEPETAKAVPMAPAVRKAVATPARATKRRTTAQRPAAKPPVFVAQAPALTHTPDASPRLDYVIGVYR